MHNLAEIRATTDLLAIVEADLGPPTRKGGRWFSWVCPYHPDGEDDGGSLRVTPDTGTWFCFGCEKRGDAVDWLQFQRGLTFGEACRELEGSGFGAGNGTGMRPKTKPVKPAVPPGSKWQQAAEEVAERARKCLWSNVGTGARRYLSNRGLRDETLQMWEVGYNPSKYYVPAISSEEPPSVVKGIVIPNRVQGELWGVKIRQPQGSDPKYLSLDGGTAWLWGVSNLTQPLAVLTEGEFDAMLTWQEGGDFVGVATTTGGAKFWRKEWGIYLLIAQHVLVVYDTDKSGQEGATMVLGQSHRMHRVRVPVGKDVTEAWQQGVNLRDWLMGEVAEVV